MLQRDTVEAGQWNDRATPLVHERPRLGQNDSPPLAGAQGDKGPLLPLIEGQAKGHGQPLDAGPGDGWNRDDGPADTGPTGDGRPDGVTDVAPADTVADMPDCPPDGCGADVCVGCDTCADGSCIEPDLPFAYMLLGTQGGQLVLPDGNPVDFSGAISCCGGGYG